MILFFLLFLEPRSYPYLPGKSNTSTIPLLVTKLPTQTAALTDALLQSLSSPTNRKSDVVNLISWLVRLQAGPAARNTFFKARTEVIRKYIRAIRFEGHIGMFIGDLAIVVFTGIKHTADWFLASFKENEVASCGCFCLMSIGLLTTPLYRQLLLTGQRSRSKAMQTCSESKCTAPTWIQKPSKRHFGSLTLKAKRFFSPFFSVSSHHLIPSWSAITRIRPRLSFPLGRSPLRASQEIIKPRSKIQLPPTNEQT